MSRQHVGHSQIVTFANDKVNLPAEKAREYRGQARRLREKLDSYLKDHPEFNLRKMIVAGSIAKGTALRSINDIDIGCYISGADVPTKVEELLNYLVEKLRTAFPNFKPDQISPQTFCVTVSFQGSGLDVDIVPIMYSGDPDWYGNLVSQEDGSTLRTCPPRHLEFTRSRKDSEANFAQVVRLVKFWVKKKKSEHADFRFKSFMIELVLAHLVDQGLPFDDYPEALQHFFTYLAQSRLQDRIAFADYYDEADVGDFEEPIQIIDPVNKENNVSRLYTTNDAELIMNAALEAGDAIDSALRAPTKQQTVYYWQKVFGSSFQA